jgi:hypothetical protein
MNVFQVEELFLKEVNAAWPFRSVPSGDQVVPTAANVQFGKLKLVGRGSGERKTQKGGAGYEAGTCCVALDVSDKYQSRC